MDTHGRADAITQTSFFMVGPFCLGFLLEPAVLVVSALRLLAGFFLTFVSCILFAPEPAVLASPALSLLTNFFPVFSCLTVLIITPDWVLPRLFLAPLAGRLVLFLLKKSFFLDMMALSNSFLFLSCFKKQFCNDLPATTTTNKGNMY